MPRYNTNLCNDKMKFQDCELAILRHAVDKIDKIQNAEVANDAEIKKIISILEKYLQRKKCICYGGTAINNILPKHAQFYNRNIEIPDYDFYSMTAMDDAKELADIYYREGYEEVEAKAGVHFGTYKIYVNFLAIADITFLHKEFYMNIKKEAIQINGIYYAPPNFLRMNMYLELSRPSGDVSRWEKVLKRLNLLNKYYPLQKINCSKVDFQRKMENDKGSKNIYYIVRDELILQEVIFFGGYASSLYSKTLRGEHSVLQKIPDFDVITENPVECAEHVIAKLRENGFSHLKTITHDKIGELIPEHVEIKCGKETICFIFKPIACHNYNVLHFGEQTVKIATIDTILSFYLAFYYTNQPYFFKDRIICMAQFLFDIEQKNRLEQKGILKRFSVYCFGEQETKNSIRALKNKKYQELKNYPNSREFEEWFLKYSPKNKNAPGTYIKQTKYTKKTLKKKTTTKKKKLKLYEIFTKNKKLISL